MQERGETLRPSIVSSGPNSERAGVSRGALRGESLRTREGRRSDRPKSDLARRHRLRGCLCKEED